jgi:pimeloyl-ACP methyl ester carboxylesterase
MGWSDGARAGGQSWRVMAEDVIGLLDELEVGDFRLIGHDWGLVVGYRMAFEWPQRMRQFVALGGIHLWSLDGAGLRLTSRAWHVFLIALLGDIASDRLGITERCLRAWRHAGQFSQADVETYMRVMRQPKCLQATKRFDRNVVLRELPYFARHYKKIRLTVPTLHLNGEHDPLTKGVPDSYSKYADDMSLELVPDCGHFIAEERPEWLLKRLGRFLT